MDDVDVVVVGAGVVGLAITRALAREGRQVLAIEQAPRYGTGVSSRSSEVIHAGLYGQAGSLKASLCVRGRHLLMDFCRDHHVEHRRCGKLVVATREADEAKLDELLRRGAANGVEDLQLLGRQAVAAMEPELAATGALFSPCSGIVDSHGLMTALLADAEAHGALLACHGALRHAEVAGGRWQLRVATPGQCDTWLGTRWLVNAAGLDAQAVAASLAGFPASAIPQRYLARGHYFGLARRAPFGRLIYPVPVDGGLGVHLTLDLAGQARFGPDVQWLPQTDAPGAALDYRVAPDLMASFESEIRRYWPALPQGALVPGYSGIRPKLSGPGQTPADFHIAGPAQHGCPGVVQLFGIESPGLTACLGIAEHVAERMAECE